MIQLWIPKNAGNLDPIEVAPSNGDSSDRRYRPLGRPGFPLRMKQHALEAYYFLATDEQRTELLEAA